MIRPISQLTKETKMQSFILKQSTNHPSFILFATSNSFGDQILQIRYENNDGMQKYVWTELNHEGNWRDLTPAFIQYMTALVELDQTKIEQKWG